jgi:hypothetical protein
MSGQSSVSDSTKGMVMGQVLSMRSLNLGVLRRKLIMSDTENETLSALKQTRLGKLGYSPVIDELDSKYLRRDIDRFSRFGATSRVLQNLHIASKVNPLRCKDRRALHVGGAAEQG